MEYDLRKIGAGWNIYGNYVNGERWGSGHINDTFSVTYNQGGTCVRYIFQRINHSIFTDPPALMENIRRVTEHQHARLDGEPDSSRRALTVVPHRDGASFLKDDSGNYWRCYLFVENASTYDKIQTTQQAYEAARAFGEFQNILSDLPGDPLTETIPDFHNTPKRYSALKKAIESDSANRAVSARPEIDFALECEKFASVLLKEQEAGVLPLRTTHNDTKLNNVMLDDETGKGICVIDLDTVMPGLTLYDFGDLVRTSVSPAAEDERDLSMVAVRMDMFEALVRGYLETAGGFLSEAERSYLAFSGKLITLEIGVRFLTDYLESDVYFKVHRQGHNLDRCRAQFALVKAIIDREEDMSRTVRNGA